MGLGLAVSTYIVLFKFSRLTSTNLSIVSSRKSTKYK